MNNIRERRLALGMTQPDLSKKLREIDPRLDVGMVSRFEQDVCLPTEAVLKGLETALQASRSKLYSTMELAAMPQDTDAVSPYTEVVASLIPFGKNNAVSRQGLAAAMGMTDMSMRKAISQARREGLVIINDQDGRGYYRSDDIKDIKRQRDQTHHRAMSLLAQEKHLNARIKAAETANV